MDRTEIMLSYVESYYKNSRFYLAQNYAKGQEFNRIHAIMEDLPNQFHPQTATWGLRLWEELYDLESAGSIAERRMRVLSKMSILQNVTPISLERLIKRIYQIHASIIRNVEPYIFKLELDYEDKGMDLADLKAVRKLVEEYKEAHMAYSLLGHYDTEFHVDIGIINEIAIKSEYFPRSNIFYANRLHIKSKLKPHIIFFPIAQVQNIFHKSVCTETTFEYKNEISDTKRLEKELGMEKEIQIPVHYEICLKIGKHPNRYDGKCRYNGKSRYYFAQEEVL